MGQTAGRRRRAARSLHLRHAEAAEDLMWRVFADTVYWIALAHPLDQWHPRAVRAGRAIRGAKIVTSDEVLIEFLAHFSGQGRLIREGAGRYVDRIFNNPDIIVRPQSRRTFLDGFALYKRRPD